MSYTEQTNYHRILRVSAVVMAIALVFQSGVVSDSTAVISQGTHAYLANAVGMSASVEPNELNRYTAALTEKEQELAAREAALEEREIAVDLQSRGETSSDTATYVMASILFILLVLIVLNYTLDYLRLRELRQQQTV